MKFGPFIIWGVSVQIRPRLWSVLQDTDHVREYCAQTRKYMALAVDSPLEPKRGRRDASRIWSWKAAQVVVACISKVANTMQINREDMCCSQMSSTHQRRATINCNDRNTSLIELHLLPYWQFANQILAWYHTHSTGLGIFVVWTEYQTVACHGADVRTSLVLNWVCNQSWLDCWKSRK